MKWEGFAVARPVSDEELRHVSGNIFGVEPSTVVIVERLEEALKFPPAQIRCLVIRWRLQGEFPLWVEIAPHGRLPPWDELETMRKLARSLGAALLIADAAPDPTTWLRVSPNGRIEHVVVDSKALDHNMFVITKVQPAS